MKRLLLVLLRNKKHKWLENAAIVCNDGFKLTTLNKTFKKPQKSADILFKAINWSTDDFK